MRSRISIRGYVRPSVGPSSGRPSVTYELKPCKSAVFDQNYYQYQRQRIIWPCIRPCFSNYFLSSIYLFELMLFVPAFNRVINSLPPDHSYHEQRMAQKILHGRWFFQYLKNLQCTASINLRRGGGRVGLCCGWLEEDIVNEWIWRRARYRSHFGFTLFVADYWTPNPSNFDIFSTCCIYSTYIHTIMCL